jgi:hypothetical protein
MIQKTPSKALGPTRGISYELQAASRKETALVKITIVVHGNY